MNYTHNINRFFCDSIKDQLIAKARHRPRPQAPQSLVGKSPHPAYQWRLSNGRKCEFSSVQKAFSRSRVVTGNIEGAVGQILENAPAFNHPVLHLPFAFDLRN